jgi:hypothetical protein
MGSLPCESAEMRTGVNFCVSSDDRQRLEAVVADGNIPQKHVWRTRIILRSDDGLGTTAIMAETGKGAELSARHFAASSGA